VHGPLSVRFRTDSAMTLLVFRDNLEFVELVHAGTPLSPSFGIFDKTLRILDAVGPARVPA
jgi:hypothetical protein